MARMEYYILNDPDLSFKDILKRHLCGEPLSDKKPEKEKKETKKIVVEEEKETRSKKRGSPAKRTRKSEKEKTEEEEEMEVEEKKGREPKKSSSEEKDEKSMPAPTMTPERRKASISIQPPQISLQQMEQMMAKGSKYDVELMNDLVILIFSITAGIGSLYCQDPNTGHLKTGNIRKTSVFDIRFLNVSLDHFMNKEKKTCL